MQEKLENRICAIQLEESGFILEITNVTNLAYDSFNKRASSDKQQSLGDSKSEKYKEWLLFMSRILALFSWNRDVCKS